MKRALRSDPTLPGLVLFAAIVVAGFVVILLGWRVAARTLYVAEQVPAIVSGGFAGIALVVIGAVLMHVVGVRRIGRRERADTAEVLEQAARALLALRRLER